MLAEEIIQKPFGALTSEFSLIKRVEDYVDGILPLDAHKMATGRLYVSVTCREAGSNTLACEFESRESLIKVSHCFLSTLIVPY